ncbi:DHH family phosphoesterase [Halomicroarcula sp. F13]|uniref:DHH family phosphoesterase n=1 Tax=Haloarcula rubra TaxID=2487747 RepID=A0AAW4PL49_9EURY|nr:DHHA1 domain-containing protein [Halomicroarcula rubra]MBX0321851.1 DHH family phosphoesterase [Halomicroarcula rubra]
MSQVASGDLATQAERVAAFAIENPAVAVAALLVLLLAFGLAVSLYRYLTRTPADRLVSVLGRYDEVAVLMHPNPDPDAMSSALAVDQLAAAVDTDSTLYYPGEIRRPENRAFETVLDLDFDRIETAGDIAADQVVLVDHNEARGFPGAGDVDPVAVVDHHPGGGTGRQFTDVRTDTGACATIFAEYFQSRDWEFYDVDTALTDGGVETGTVPEDALPSHVATGLIYGIQSDTRSLTNGCSSDDFAAAAYLYEGIDGDLLNRIANPQIDAEVLDVKARAITERVVNPPFAYSDVGEVSNTDAIPQAADELETLEGISAVVVVGECDGTLRIAGRSRDDRVHIGRAIEAVVESIPMGEGGGHARMGGGQIPVEYMAGIGPSDGISREDLRQQVFDAMAGER